MKIQNDRVVVNGGVQTIIYFMLSVIVVLFFALGNLNQDVEFRSTIIFMTVFMASYILLLGLSVSPAIGKYLQGKNVQLFFQHDVTVGKLFWIPIGVVSAFGVSLLINNAGFDATFGSLLAIGSSGMIMMAIFFRTGSILIPIIIHGIFNSLVIILSSPLLNLKILSNTPIPIPEIGISFGTLNSLASESIYQLFLVSTSEEMFKMMVLAFVLVVVKNRFDSKSVWVYIGGAVSVAIWTVYHMIQAL